MIGAKILYLTDFLDYLEELQECEINSKNGLLAEIRNHAVSNAIIPDMEEIVEDAYIELEARKRMEVIKEILIKQFELSSEDAEMLTNYDSLSDDELFSCKYKADNLDIATELLMNSPRHIGIIKKIIRNRIGLQQCEQLGIDIKE